MNHQDFEYVCTYAGEGPANGHTHLEAGNVASLPLTPGRDDRPNHVAQDRAVFDARKGFVPP